MEHRYQFGPDPCPMPGPTFSRTQALVLYPLYTGPSARLLRKIHMLIDLNTVHGMPFSVHPTYVRTGNQLGTCPTASYRDRFPSIHEFSRPENFDIKSVQQS